MSVTSTTTPSSQPLDRRRTAIVVVGAAVLVALGAWIGSMYGGMIDLRVYRLGGDALLHGPALAGKLERDVPDAFHFRYRVAHGVESRRCVNPARLAVVHVAVQFAQDQQIEPIDHFALQRR